MWMRMTEGSSVVGFAPGGSISETEAALLLMATMNRSSRVDAP